MKKLLLLSMGVLSFGLLIAQDTIQGYVFTPVNTCEVTDIENQQRTGTCWCFSSHSFFESEMARLGKPVEDLSEMYAVYYTYLRKAENYVRRHGTANFDEGALAHDAVFAMARYGLMPESRYAGLVDGATVHDHGKMVKEMAKYLKKLLKKHKNSPPEGWQNEFKGILGEYLGTPPSDAMLAPINPDDYISLTSFTHHPYYRSFVLEVPDNWSNGSFYNVTPDELVDVARYALENGFTITWDGDVSEKSFSARNSLALWPENNTEEGRKAAFQAPQPEHRVTDRERQEAFDRWELTDDHLMHIVALAEDQQGNRYFKVKNSWGTIGPGEGYLYMSEAYFRYGTVSLLLHREGIPEAIRRKLGL